MCKGFIKIPRRIYEERLWNVKRVYSELDAFCDIYASAYTRDYKYPDGTKIKRNQLPCSLRSLADKWIWNQMKVKRFLQALERKGYIAIKSDKSKTILTILDFGIDDTSVTQGVTQPVTPLLHQNTHKQGTFEVVDVTQPVTQPVTQGVTYIKNKEDNKENNIINKDSLSCQESKSNIDLSIVSEDMIPIVEEWLQYKKERKQTYKPAGFKTFYKQLVRFSDNDSEKARTIIERSMANNWAGIFELKQYETTRNNYSSNQGTAGNPSDDQMVRDAISLINGLAEKRRNCCQ